MLVDVFGDGMWRVCAYQTRHDCVGVCNGGVKGWTKARSMVDAASKKAECGFGARHGKGLAREHVYIR